MAAAALIGVDWGTSSFRAMRIDAAGTVIDQRTGPRGILTVEDGDFAGVLRGFVGDWLDASPMPVLMSGMIGSRQGWAEASYRACPAGLEDLADGLLAVPFDAAQVRIVPGLEAAGEGMRDVMRGEEIQVLGALAADDAADGLFLLPGTHSKWVEAVGGRIVGFSTYMTGEIYAACRGHTILGRLMAKEAGPSRKGFSRGVRDGGAEGNPGALLNRLFGVRTAGLFGDLADTDLGDYLSGLLIGAEIADARGRRAGPVRIIASDMLAERYAGACAELGVSADIVASDRIAHGYAALARLAGLTAQDGGRDP